MSDDDPPDRRTRYLEMSDADFVEGLRRGLPDRSWTIGQMVELERRGLGVTESDPELHAALTESLEAIGAAMEPIIERLTEQLAPLQKVFRTISAGVPHLSVKLPKLDVERMTLPTQEWSDATFRPVGAGLVPSQAAPTAQSSAGDGIGQIIEGEASRLAKRAALEEAQLGTATATLAMEGHLDKLVKAHQRDWIFWLMFCFAAVAAVGVVVTIILQLG